MVLTPFIHNAICTIFGIPTLSTEYGRYAIENDIQYSSESSGNARAMFPVGQRVCNLDKTRVRV